MSSTRTQAALNPRLRPVAWTLAVWLALAGVLVGIWRLGSSFGEVGEPLVLQGRPAREYFPLWIKRGTNGMGFVQPPSLNHNKLTGEDIVTMLRLAERPAPSISSTLTRLWPSLPAFIQSRLPIPQAAEVVQSLIYQEIHWPLQSRPELATWLARNFYRIPTNSRPAFLRYFARARAPSAYFDSTRTLAPPQDPELTEALNAIYERHLDSPDPRARLDAVLGLIRLPGNHSKDYPRLVNAIRPELNSPEVDPAAWNRIGLALLEKPAGGAAFRSLFEALSTNTVVDAMAAVPIAHWAMSEPLPPLSEFARAFLDRNAPAAGVFFVYSLRVARPPLAMDPGMVSVISRLVARTNEVAFHDERDAGVFNTMRPADRLRNALSSGLPLDLGRREHAVGLLEHLDAPKTEIARALVPMLSHPNGDVKRGAAALLVKLGPDVGIDPIEIRGPLSDPEVFHALVRWLGQCGPRASALIPDLLPRLNDSDRVIRDLVSSACLQIAPSDPRLLDHWVGSLRDPALQPMAVMALSGYGASVPDVAVAKLGAIVADESTARGMTELRVAAAETLSTIGEPARPALPALQEAARSPQPNVKRAAEKAIEALRGQ